MYGTGTVKRVSLQGKWPPLSRFCSHEYSRTVSTSYKACKCILGSHVQLSQLLTIVLLCLKP